MAEENISPEEMLARYAAGVEELDAALAGLSEAQLDLAREDGKWTIRQIVHHIADAEDIWKTCIKAALGNSGCTFDFSWYITDNKCAEPLDYAHRPIADAVELFKVARRHAQALVEHLPEAFEKFIIFKHTGMPDEGKKFTVSEMIAWQVQHLALHIEQIRDTRKKHDISD